MDTYEKGGTCRGEGSPSGKLGTDYVPDGGEDHVTHAQVVGERIESTGPHKAPPPVTSSVAAGHTNPMVPPSSPQRNKQQDDRRESKAAPPAQES